jgi:tetratricopeptide (TPR) repeat protein
MIRSGRALPVIPLLVCALASPVARADKAAAKQLTERATVAYKLGHFQESLEEFSAAYREFGAPLLLFNLGQCYRELGNYERASFFLHGYLHEVPRAKNRALVEDLITECESKLAAEQAELRRRQEEEKEQRALKLAEANLLAEQQQPAQIALFPLEGPAVDRVGLLGQQRAGRTKLAAGLGIAGAGVVALGVGVYFSARSSSDASTIDQVDAQGQKWTQGVENTYRDGSRSVVIADVLYAAGATVVVAGGVLAVLGWQQGASAKKALSIAGIASPNGGPLALAWVF